MKKVYFEVMRIIAMCLVIFNHLPGYGLYQISTGWKQFIYMTLTMFTRINVPLFFMISGALLLKKQEKMEKILRKRFLRFLILIFIFEAGMFFCYKINATYNNLQYEFSIKRFLNGFMAGNLDGVQSYWYLYAYLGILLILPFMQRIANGLTKVEVSVLLTGHFLFCSFLPVMNLVLSSYKLDTICLSNDFSVPFIVVKAFFYPIIGYYLEYFIDISKFRKRHIIRMIILLIVGILISNCCTYIEKIQIGSYTQNYVELFDYMSAIIIFLLIKYIVCSYENIFMKNARKICILGSLTLGIYLLDPYLKLFLYYKYEMFMIQKFPVLVVSIGWVLISMFLGATITAIIRKLPGLKRIL